jgi:hypothetical protein
MSWLFSQALVEAFSAATCSAGEPSAPSNGTLTPPRCCSPVRTTEPCPHSPCGTTCRLSTAEPGEELLTSYLAGFPVRTSQSQASEPASTENGAGCGSTWRGWLAKYDPATSSWRTAQRSFIEDSGESLETLPRSGTTRDGLLWEQPTLELHTSATDSGLWPTPVADDTGSRSKKYAQGGTPLSLAVKLYPTPTAGNEKSGGYLGEWGGSGARKQMASLVPAEEMFGPLNPEWVEWLMGWPIGWTDLRPLEMDRFREWQQQHGAFSAANDRKVA